MRIIFTSIAFLSLLTIVFSCGETASKQNNHEADSTINATIFLDNFFNNEFKQEGTEQVRWHYLWEDTSMGGFSELGEMFEKEGATLQTLQQAPTAENLKNASVYIIADPDNEEETPAPNFMNETNAASIADWVKAGGVLVLMANDSANCELDKFNLLSKKFGITFNKDNKLVVQDPHFKQGEVTVDANNAIFKTAKNIYIKGICSVTTNAPAETLLKTNEFDIMAIAKHGKGTVFALGDPWIYNEYIGHKRLPNQFENDKASSDWVKWILKNVTVKN